MHWLTVRHDPTVALDVSHDEECPIQRRPWVNPRTGVRTTAPLISCTMAQLIEAHGIETWFVRAGNEDDGYANAGRISLQPGAYAIGVHFLRETHHAETGTTAVVAQIRLLADAA